MAHNDKLNDFFGLSAESFHQVNIEFKINKLIKDDFEKMRQAALAQNIDIQIISSHRDFDHQLRIWNEKATGKRVIRDDQEMIVNIQDLNQEELLAAIMRYSAVPGLSRHHLGTDIDVYDANAKSEDMVVSLVASEYEAEGPFGKLSQWLQDNLESFGFYLPYSHDRGKLGREPWHISHRLTAKKYFSKMTHQSVRSFYQQFSSEEFALVDQVLLSLEDIFKDYIDPY